MVPSSFGTTRFLSKPNVWHNHPIAVGASRYRRTGMTVALVFFAILGTMISFCLCDAQRRSSAAAAEERSDEDDVGWNELLGVTGTCTSLSGHGVVLDELRCELGPCWTLARKQNFLRGKRHWFIQATRIDGNHLGCRLRSSKEKRPALGTEVTYGRQTAASRSARLLYWPGAYERLFRYAHDRDTATT